MEIKTFPLTEVKAGAADGLAENEFSGYASTFGPPVDSYGDIIEPGAFQDAIPEFLEKGFIGYQHDWNTPIGKPLEAHEDSRGLYLRARVSDTAAGRDALTLMRDRVITQLSIGYKAASARTLDEAEVVARWGQTVADEMMRALPLGMQGPRALIKIYPLFETSPVSVAANQNAVISGVKELGLLAGPRLEDQYEFVLAANEELITRFRGLADLRLKEGRVLSEANRQRLMTIGDSLEGHAGDIRTLLAATEPTPKETPKDGADVAARVTALRAAHMRLIRLSLTTQE